MIKKITLLALFIFAFSWQGMGQSITIGTGTDDDNGSDSGPIDDYFVGIVYQTVYTQAEMSASMIAYNEITALGFSVSEITTGVLADYTIKIGHTTATDCAAHITSLDMTVVKGPFSYTPTATAAGVFDMITFDTNFVWNGLDNIVIEICTDGNSVYASPYGGVRTTAMTNGSRKKRSDSAAMCGVATTQTNPERPNVKFTYITGTPPTCTTPTALAGAATSFTDATFTWTHASATDFTYEYGATGYTQGTPIASAAISATTVGISGLTAGDSYDFYVQTNCGGSDGDSIWIGPFTWMQPAAVGDACVVPIMATLVADCSTATPYVVDFATAVDLGASSCDDIGLNVGKWFQITAPASGALKVNTTDMTDMAIYTDCDTEIYCNSSLPDSFSLSGLTAGSSYLIKIWKDSATSGTSNVCFEEITCTFPTGLTATNATANTVDLAWTAGDAGHTDWQYVVQTAGTGIPDGTTAVNVTAVSASVGSLSPGTNYEAYVRTSCGGGDYSEWFGPVNFTTACAPFGSFNEDFESYATSVMPNCWSKFISSSSTSPYVKTSSLSTNSGTRALRMGNGSVATTNLYAITPELTDLPNDTHQLRFFAKGSSSMSLEIGTMTDPADESTYTQKETLTLTGNHQEFTVIFNTSVTDSYIAIKGVSSSTYGYISIDDVVWEVVPTCTPPTGLTVSNITTDATDLSWTAGDAGHTDWQYVIQAAGTGTPDGTTAVDVTTTSLTVSPLNASTDYEVYVRTDCGGGDYSEWFGPVNFSTPCPVENTFPFTEGFENAVAPDCWTEVRNPSSSSYGWSSNSNGNTGKCARFNSYLNSNGNVSIMSTMAFDITALGTPELSFYYKNDTGGDFTVQISTDGGATFSDLETGLTGQSSWIQKTYDLSSYSSNNVVVAFKGTSNYGSNDAYVYLDDMKIEDAAAGVAVNTIAGFAYYPNPVNDQLSLRANNTIDQVELMNILGQTVLTVKPSTTSTAIDMSSLNQGAYFVRVQVGDAIQTVKVIKQ